MDLGATGEMTIGLSFLFDDGSLMKHAFKYDWRVRSVKTVASAMRDAGFQHVCIFADGHDNTGAYMRAPHPQCRVCRPQSNAAEATLQLA